MPGRIAASQFRSIGSDRISFHGKFRPDGSGGIVADSDIGVGWTVARSGVGLYTITLDRIVPTIFPVSCAARSADGTPKNVTFGDYDATKGTIQLRVSDVTRGEAPINILSVRIINTGTDDIDSSSNHGGMVANDSTPDLNRILASVDNSLRLNWVASDSHEVQIPPLPMMPSLTGASNLELHMVAKMGGSTDTPTIDVQAFDGIGDTEMGGPTAALSDTLAEYTVSLAAANLAGHPLGFVNVALIPGAHTTDVLTIHSMWWEWDTAADLTDDVDNEIAFELIARNNSGSY